MQAVEAVLAAGESEFAAQSVQASPPAASLYLPATHASHAPPSGPVYPALHMQAVEAVLAAGESDSEGHSVQDLGPGRSLYVPIAHTTQAVLSTV